MMGKDVIKMNGPLQLSSVTLNLKPSMIRQQSTQTGEQLTAELELIRAAQADPSRFKPLYEQYYESIFRFVYQRTGDEHLTADLCATVFLKALQNLHRYEFRGLPFSAWLYRIALNQVTQHFRQTGKRQFVSIESGRLADMAAQMNEEPQRWQQAQYKQQLLDVMQSLKPEELRLVEMRFFEERPFKEIADILDISESNAKVRTYRILERMKKHLLKSLKQ